ncbi:UDP-3-O-(3-hydroxymyristoyl)glucosamine N-acyltransferase [Legionella spiritensis]|uniref:UDP-3-O-[3-hydroxymyristoyl] glucosamine N-acyltransferase n=1 Tax=Legionella spiritensis TaxID=452 RepID=A0A0W0Z9T6_LEGSP|nr:UDP-3-O-(3-hydroxymyristoyl)glucosamine N-acyltransferase [Legionella spiritensis]KTD65877.1 UDP-3-O-[3-hydroxymyristoyl] glucosamine N-acyltransferase [Legionella spiritensis]SNV32095.1 UDP-3-O-[3-hydroxymyristoyl] glucosamine N-acyltransferase [Legionella spiritensis]
MSYSCTLSELSSLLNGVLHGQEDRVVQGVASLSRATETDVAYYDDPLLTDVLNTSQAGVVLLSAPYSSSCPLDHIVVKDPLDGIMLTARLFEQSESLMSPGIHSSAIIAATAQIKSGVSIGANSIIGDQVMVARDVHIGEHCVIENGVTIGPNTSIAAGSVIGFGTRVGSQVVIDRGVVLGALPFNGVKNRGEWRSGPTRGGVVVYDRVVIGANTVIARGSLGDTCIGEDVRIDNLVHIAHDVIIGSHTAIAGCAAVGAFVRIGSHCVIGGASCIAANVQLLDDIVITGMSTVSKSLKKAGLYSSGTMVSEHNRWRRNAARFRRLDDYILRVAKLEKMLRNLFK